MHECLHISSEVSQIWFYAFWIQSDQLIFDNILTSYLILLKPLFYQHTHFVKDLMSVCNRDFHPWQHNLLSWHFMSCCVRCLWPLFWPASFLWVYAISLFAVCESAYYRCELVLVFCWKLWSRSYVVWLLCNLALLAWLFE